MDWTRGRNIGRGSTATVCVATVDQSRVFAVKSSELSQSESLRKEQRILSTLSCPHVVGYKGCDISSENGKLLYNLFLEYAPSGTVMDAIQKHGGYLEEATVRSYTRGILLGLEFLHSRGIVHCDIKGQNVLVTDDGVKIADLGCARRADEASSAAWSIAGTPVYMAPEVARGEQQGCSADVWALGCTVIEMAAGRSPWPDVSDPVSALYRIGFSSDVPEIPTNISKQAQDFLRKCLRRDPADRWSATQLLSHDFLAESKFPVKETDGSKSETPNNVLHPNIWDSMEELETVQIPSNKPIMERLRQLGEDNLVLSSKIPNWECDENWLTVRSNSNLEVEKLPSTSRQDSNLLRADEPTSSCGGYTSRKSEDFEILVDCFLTKIRRQNTRITNSDRVESRSKTGSFAACRYMTYAIENKEFCDRLIVKGGNDNRVAGLFWCRFNSNNPNVTKLWAIMVALEILTLSWLKIYREANLMADNLAKSVVFLASVCDLLSCLVPMLSVFIIIWAVNRGGRCDSLMLVVQQLRFLAKKSANAPDTLRESSMSAMAAVLG
ncbi:hypothetical protein J1N35_030932 [Gossypium stocksii]|uniref:Protein kinase domain-containing protein n=1 Tax=Gossypium stocksii TaxID=47602 RepID=A0A9D3V0Z8_9ROSI|nr:hypothetical protein J1N35_030932 [Gossypium stocksii]